MTSEKRKTVLNLFDQIDVYRKWKKWKIVKTNDLST